MLPRNGYSSAAEELAQEDERYYRELPAIPRQHQIGRTPPVVEEVHFDIAIDGQLLGTVYPLRLKGEAQFAMERCTSALQIIGWMETYANGNAAHIEQVLSKLAIQEIKTFIQGVAQALTESMSLSKPSGPRS